MKRNVRDPLEVECQLTKPLRSCCSEASFFRSTALWAGRLFWWHDGALLSSLASVPFMETLCVRIAGVGVYSGSNEELGPTLVCFGLNFVHGCYFVALLFRFLIMSRWCDAKA